MRIWFKIFKENRMLRDMTVEDVSSETRTHKIYNAIDEACMKFDLEKPIWLDANVKDFKRCAKTRFTKDSFVESIEFDFLELQVIEEDF